MNPTERFLAYAAAFEQTYADDDWSRIEPFFTEDAVYTVSLGPPLGGCWEGRVAVIDHLREGVEGLDRRFDTRRVEIVGAPSAGDNFVFFEWQGTYSKAGCPDLVFGGTERASFEGDRIRLLEDEMAEGSDTTIQEWVARVLD